MIQLRSFQNYLFFFISIILFCCDNKKQLDVSDINVNIKIERFDEELKELTPSNLAAKALALHEKYRFFYEDYMEKMLGVGVTIDSAYYANLRQVIKNKDYKDLEAAVSEKFPNLKSTEVELTDAFRHIKYYYPKQKLPRLISFLSGFAVQTPIGNDYIGIGLDMFLGNDSKFYPALTQSIPLYISRRFTPENITPRTIEAYLREDMFPENDNEKSLLAKMIYNGKILYFMDAVMPDKCDSLKIGYTKQQQEWSEKFEAEIWGYFLEQNLLYESDYMKIQKYLTDAPFTPGIGEKNESAPKLGIFIGWQIVKKYMDRNENVSLQQLMKEADYQKILNLSKYKPK